MKPLTRYGAVVCAVILGACGKDATGPDSTPELNADLAVVLADATGEDVDIMREPVLFTTMSPNAAPGNGDLNPSNCTLNAGSQRIVCPPITRNGSLVVTRSYQFFDALGVVQQAYDALLTAKANIQTTVKGEWSGPTWSATIDRARDMTVTGLLGEETERTWNGTGTSSATHSRHTDNGDRSYDISCTLTVVNVVVPVERGSDRFPISGTITRHCTVTITGPRGGKTVDRTATVTFDGTRTASLAIGDKIFDIDLKSRNRIQRP